MGISSDGFSIDKTLLGIPTNVQISADGPDGDPIVLSLLHNTTFPDGKQPLGSLKLSASAGTSIPFSAAGGNDTVTFQATAGGFFAGGLYPDPADLLKDLSPERDIAAGLSLSAATGFRYLMLRCGYNVGVTAKGAMALGTGVSANFSGSVNRDAAYAVIHGFENTEHARDVLQGAIRSWILPSQFDGADANGDFRLPPRTWIVTEVDGSVALSLGVQAGYDYSWMRQFPGGVLKGDLGLKVQLAANAALGFSANGTFALVLCRETKAPVFRLRLFKLEKNGWNFALNASAGAQVVLPDIFKQEKNVDDLIAAVFGLHTAQLVEDLTDPNFTNPASLAKFIVTAGKAKVDEFAAQWKALTHKPATMLAAILKQNKDVARLITFLQQIQGLDEDGVKSLLKKEMSKADFFQTSVGQFLDTAVDNTPFSALLSTKEWQTIQSLAGKALDIINGKTLASLIDYAAKNLALDVIGKIGIDDVSGLDPWLQAKLANFLGKDPTAKLVLADIQNVQKALKALKDNAAKFYDLARQAVQKKYEIAFTSTYQKSTTTTALLDVSFDLSAQPSPLGLLRQAIRGDMQQLLLQQFPGVTLATATLTHDINRHGHSELSMPFVDLSTDDVSDSIAGVEPVEDNGRVLVYKLHATDEVKKHSSFFHAQSASDSKLALVSTIPVHAGVTVFSPPSISYGYTLTKASLAMGAAQLQQDMTPLVGEYMPGLFAKKPLGDWISAVDAQVDPVNQGVLGQTLFTFDVTLPPEAFQAWFNTSQNAKDPQYFALSKAIQKRLRQIIPFYYFQDPGRYDGGIEANAILAYSALPAANGANEIYFDLDSSARIAALMNDPAFSQELKSAIERAFSITGGSDFYRVDAGNIKSIVHDALKKISDQATLPAVLGPLLLFEFGLIGSVVQAAVGLAKFRAAAGSDPASAIAQLAGFGDTFVRAFNKHLGGNLVAGSYLRPLGTALFVEAGRALAHNAAPVKPAAMFRLTVVESTPALGVDDMVAGNLGQAQVLLRQTLVSI